MAKSRPVSLISRSFCANQSSMLDSGTSENCRLSWNSDLTSTEKLGRDRSENSASSFQVWHRGDNPIPSTERSGREMNRRSSSGKRGREVQNQLTEVILDHHHLKISNTRYIENAFPHVRQKLHRPENDQIVLDHKSHCIDMGIICVNNNESSDTSWRAFP